MPQCAARDEDPLPVPRHRRRADRLQALPRPMTAKRLKTVNVKRRPRHEAADAGRHRGRRDQRPALGGDADSCLRFLGLKHVYLDTEDKVPAYEAMQGQTRPRRRAMCTHGRRRAGPAAASTRGPGAGGGRRHPMGGRRRTGRSRHRGGHGAVREAADLDPGRSGMTEAAMAQLLVHPAGTRRARLGAAPR